MRIIVISSSPLVEYNDCNYAYSPYVKELEIWAKYSDEIAFCCPIWNNDKGLLISKINFPIAKMFITKEFNIKSLYNFIKAFQYSFSNFFKIFQAMIWADHIHLRCPGNIGLMGCMIQILFPNKSKTAKYAGNWDLKDKQPLSYRIQKWILRNTFLTKNMKVLVYGEWENSSKNIKTFFTATYKEADKVEITPRELNKTIQFLFVGTLSEGKRPLYAIQIIEKLMQLGHNVTLQFFGEGDQRDVLQEYCNVNNLNTIVEFKGNQKEVTVREAYKQSHFVILPSQSEGWPKVIAEAMFWGCFPVTTKISCLGTMLDDGGRGLFLKINLKEDSEQLIHILQNQEEYNTKVLKSILWSRKYTLDLFENEIKAMLNS